MTRGTIYNDYACADAARSKAQTKLDKINKYLLLSVIVTIVLWIAILVREPLFTALESLSLGESVTNGVLTAARVLVNGVTSLLFAAFVVIYAITGAFREVLKIVHTCGKVAWYITPFFGVDIGMYFLGVFVGLLIVVFFPCFALLLCRSRVMKETAAAEAYIQRVTPVDVG